VLGIRSRGIEGVASIGALPNGSTSIEAKIESLLWASTATAIQLQLATHSVQGHIKIGSILEKYCIKLCSK